RRAAPDAGRRPVDRIFADALHRLPGGGEACVDLLDRAARDEPRIEARLGRRERAAEAFEQCGFALRLAGELLLAFGDLLAQRLDVRRGPGFGRIAGGVVLSVRFHATS